MTDMKVVNGHVIFTPGNDAFAFVAPTHMSEPDLLAERLGYGGFWFFGFFGFFGFFSRRLLYFLHTIE
jgi:hypothetical protein